MSCHSPPLIQIIVFAHIHLSLFRVDIQNEDSSWKKEKKNEEYYPQHIKIGISLTNRCKTIKASIGVIMLCNTQRVFF